MNETPRYSTAEVAELYAVYREDDLLTRLKKRHDTDYQAKLAELDAQLVENVKEVAHDRP